MFVCLIFCVYARNMIRWTKVVPSSCSFDFNATTLPKWSLCPKKLFPFRMRKIIFGLILLLLLRPPFLSIFHFFAYLKKKKKVENFGPPEKCHFWDSDLTLSKHRNLPCRRLWSSQQLVSVQLGNCSLKGETRLYGGFCYFSSGVYSEFVENTVAWHSLFFNE